MDWTSGFAILAPFWPTHLGMYDSETMPGGLSLLETGHDRWYEVQCCSGGPFVGMSDCQIE